MSLVGKWAQHCWQHSQHICNFLLITFSKRRPLSSLCCSMHLSQVNVLYVQYVQGCVCMGTCILGRHQRTFHSDRQLLTLCPTCSIQFYLYNVFYNSIFSWCFTVRKLVARATWKSSHGNLLGCCLLGSWLPCQLVWSLGHLGWWPWQPVCWVAGCHVNQFGCYATWGG